MQLTTLFSVAFLATRASAFTVSAPNPVITTTRIVAPDHHSAIVNKCGPEIITCGIESPLIQTVTEYAQNVTVTVTETSRTQSISTSMITSVVVEVIDRVVNTIGYCETIVTVKNPQNSTVTHTVATTSTELVILEVPTITTVTSVRDIVSTSACLVASTIRLPPLGGPVVTPNPHPHNPPAPSHNHNSSVGSSQSSAQQHPSAGSASSSTASAPRPSPSGQQPMQGGGQAGNSASVIRAALAASSASSASSSASSASASSARRP